MAIRLIGCGLTACVLLACSDRTPVQSETAKSTRQPSAATSAPSSASAPATVERLSNATGDGAQAAQTATTYLHGVVKRDWGSVCSTRAHAEQAELARLGGSCERSMEKMFANQPVDLFATAALGEIRKRGATIAVDIVQPGQAKPAMTLLLRQEDARWLLVDLPDSDEF